MSTDCVSLEMRTAKTKPETATQRVVHSWWLKEAGAIKKARSVVRDQLRCKSRQKSPDLTTEHGQPCVLEGRIQLASHTNADPPRLRISMH